MSNENDPNQGLYNPTVLAQINQNKQRDYLADVWGASQLNQISGLTIPNSDPSDPLTLRQLDLSVAQRSGSPYEINFEMTGIQVEEANDPTAYVLFRPNSALAQNEIYKLADGIGRDFPGAIKGGQLFWPSQPGKTLRLICYRGGSYRSTRILSVSAGGVNVLEGASVTSNAKGTVGTSAAILLAANLSRKVTVLQNQSGNSIYVGSAAVTLPSGSNPGIEIPPGGYWYHKNTGALYAIASVSTPGIAILEEV